MARQTYPLETLRKLRDEKAEALLQALAKQVARTQSAEGTLAERERVRREHAARTAEAVQAEQQRLAAGGASGVDLLRVADFELAARVQAGLLERAEADARQVLAQERAAEQKLREQQAA